MYSFKGIHLNSLNTLHANKYRIFMQSLDISKDISSFKVIKRILGFKSLEQWEEDWNPFFW